MGIRGFNVLQCHASLTISIDEDYVYIWTIYNLQCHASVTISIDEGYVYIWTSSGKSLGKNNPL